MIVSPYRSASGTTVQEAYDEVSARNRQVEVAGLSAFEVDEETGKLRVPSLGEFRMTRHAVRQLAGKTGVPAAWAHKAPTDVVARTFNYYLPSQNGNVVLHVEDEDLVVGIATDHIAPLPTPPILERIPNVDDFESIGWRLEESGLALRLKSHNGPSAQPRLGDMVESGVEMMFREYGDQGLGLRAMLYRLVCLNGATAAEYLPARTTLRKEGWRSDGARIELALGQLEDVTLSMGEMVSTLVELPTVPFTLPTGEDDAEEAAARLRAPMKVLGIPSKFAGSIADAMRAEEPTLFGLYNAVTRLGRDSAAPREREVFERAGIRALRRFPDLSTATEVVLD